MDDSPDRRVWVDKLLRFMEERGTPILQCPTISKNPLDLFRLYIYVKERGGFMEVCKVRYSFNVMQFSPVVLYTNQLIIGHFLHISKESRMTDT